MTRARIARARALLLVVLVGGLGCNGAPEHARNVVLVSVDTLRADHLGCYGHPLPTSPNLDAVAAAGVLFEDASSTAPWTLPAHASLLTGLTPVSHGVRTVRQRLPSDVPTLATWLELQGFDTAAVVNSVYVGEHFGLARGFHSFRNVEPDHSPGGAAPRIVDAALAWLDAPRERPFFLFLHFFDVHSDYRSRPEVERLFVERRRPVDGSSRQLMGLAARPGSVDPEQLRYLARLYDAGIRQLDAELGRLFDALEASGRAEDTLLVVTSDHGEEFGEHGGVSHGMTQHVEVLRVPLLVRGPGIPAGVRIRTPVSLVDVAPTILALVGLEPPEELEGRSLRPLWEHPDEPLAPRPLFSGAAPAAEHDVLAAVRMGSDKLVLDERTGAAQLYDLAADPGERTDRAADEPERVRQLAGVLAAHRHRGRAAEAAEPLSRERREQLRALGYVVGEDDAPEAAP